MTTQLREICDEIMDELGLVRPTAIVDSADPNARRLLACAHRAGQDLLRAHDWSVLHREYEFTTEDGVDNYAVPEDFGKAIGGTAWDRTTFWRVRGNLTPQQWQFRRSGLVASPAMRFSFRALIGGRAASILLDPVPTGEHDLVIEYVSTYWVENTLQSPFESFESDFHHVRLDPELFTLGLTWRVRRAFGFPYADDRADYEIALKRAKVADINMPPVNTGGPDYDSLPLANIPEGSWNQ